MLKLLYVIAKCLALKEPWPFRWRKHARAMPSTILCGFWDYRPRSSLTAQSKT